MPVGISAGGGHRRRVIDGVPSGEDRATCAHRPAPPLLCTASIPGGRLAALHRGRVLGGCGDSSTVDAAVTPYEGIP